LSILGNLPRHALSTARTKKQGANLGICCKQIPQQPRVQLQGYGIEHGASNPTFSRLQVILMHETQGTMICGWDKTGPAIFYVDSDGTRLKGDLFSVGSGSTFAYGVLDQGYKWDMSDAEAQELGRRSIYAAGHRDAFSGNTVNLYHVKEQGWEFIGSFDSAKICYKRSMLTRAVCRKLRCQQAALRWSWRRRWFAWPWLWLRYPSGWPILC
jgi:Proteasome subunit